jgi:hypothetical protein
MAQIKIIGNINSSTTISRFKVEDTSLIGTQTVINNFNSQTDYVEYAVYDVVNNLLSIDYNYKNYNLPSGSVFNPDGSFPILEINPTEDLQQFTDAGEFIAQYSFFRKYISDNINRDLFIKEISPDRTELKISSTTFSNSELEQYTNNLINEKNNSSYLKTFLLNFGNNIVFPITNVALDRSDSNQYYILFKMYEPLSIEIVEKSNLWVVEEITNSVRFGVTLESQITPDPIPQLKGANFGIEVKSKNTLPTQYESHNTLLQFTGSSLHSILNHLDQKSIQINVNYSGSFNDFVRFGSALSRVENFYYKVKTIENYNNFITQYSASVATTASLQTLINQYSASINDYVSKFDGFESYLYFNSGSGTWPKANSTAPYTLLSTGSATSITWYNNIVDLATYYDTNNPDNLVYLIPEYIRIDENNEPYLTFIRMIGHYFDNIWIYLKSVTDLYKSYNNLDQGVSRDLVYYALQDLGVNIYNSSEDDDLFNYIIGDNQVPTKDLLAELYKRIYHNIPLLFKGKGSKRGLQELVTTFGLTGSILNVKEYGGDSNTSAALIDYNSNKVKVINNTIYSSSYNNTTGSVLSPYIELATDNVYVDFKNDSDRVDISFSPYNQIDKVISSSITTTYPSFSIDDYIGDPRNSSLTEYSSLNAIRNQAISSSFSYKYDINGFVQLIKYFDNTLFKMLKDYVPAKANLTEGITIRQQALERIKFKRNEPNVETSSTYDAQYEGPAISEQYGDLFTGLAGDKAPFYTGEISGSELDLYNRYFIPTNYNPYLFPSSSIDYGYFDVSDFNVLFNNISQSRLSIDRLKVELQPYSTTKLYLPVELQDSYETLESYKLSRHEGVKLIGSRYNVYNNGDISYGRNPVIDRNSYKFGWIKTIPSRNLNFYNKTQIILQYLVDPSGSLTNLNSYNKNLFEVQNIFKAQDDATVSLSDLLSPSNQTSLNGAKRVWKSGYRYDPIIYREQNETLYFQWLDSALYTSSYNLGVDTLMDNGYKYHNINAGQRTYLDDVPSLTEGTAGSPTWYEDNVAQAAYFSNYRFPSSSGIWPYTAITGANYIHDVSGSYRSNPTYSFTLPALGVSRLGDNGDGDKIAFALDNLVFDKILNYTEFTPDLYTLNDVSYNYKVPRTSTYIISSSITTQFNGIHKTSPSSYSVGAFKLFTVIEKTNTPLIESSWNQLVCTSSIQPLSYPSGLRNELGVSLLYPDGFFGYNLDQNDNTIVLGGTRSAFWNNVIMNSPFIFNLNIEQTVSLTAGEYIRARVYFISLNGMFGDGTAGSQYMDPLILEFSRNSYLNIYDSASTGTSPISTGSYTGGLPLFVTSSDTSIMVTGSVYSTFYNSSSFFTGQGSIISSSYSPVYDPFTIEKGDLFRFGSFYSPSSTYHEVTNVSASTITFSSNITSSFNNAKFAVLRRKEDETSVLIEFIKTPGEISQAFLVPTDMSTVNREKVADVAKQVSVQINNI